MASDFYIRKCNTGMLNKQHFAKQADKERDLRLMLSDPKNWLSQFFSKEPTKEEIVVLLEELAFKLALAGYEVVTLEDYIGELK